MLNIFSNSIQVIKQSFQLAFKTPVLFVLAFFSLLGIIAFSVLPFVFIESTGQSNSPLTILLVLLSSGFAITLTYVMFALIVGKVKSIQEKKKYAYLSMLKTLIKPILVLAFISMLVQLPAVFLSNPFTTGESTVVYDSNIASSESLTYVNGSVEATNYVVSLPANSPNSLLSWVAVLLANVLVFVWEYLSIFSIPILVRGEKNVLTALRQSIALVSKTFCLVGISEGIIAVILFAPVILFGLLAVVLSLTGNLMAFFAMDWFFLLFVLVGLSIIVSITAFFVVGSAALQLIYSGAIKRNIDKLDLIVDELSIKREHGAAWYFAVFMLIALIVIVGFQAASIVKVEPDWLLYVLVLLGLGVFAFAYNKK